MAKAKLTLENEIVGKSFDVLSASSKSMTLRDIDGQLYIVEASEGGYEIPVLDFWLLRPEEIS